jgi:hypothetical protein
VTWASKAEKSKFALISKQQSEQKYEKEDLRLRKRVILVKCKPFVVYFLSLNFCYSILAKTTIVANLFYFYFVYYLFFRFYSSRISSNVTWASKAEKSKFALISKQQSEQKYEKEDLPEKEK